LKAGSSGRSKTWNRQTLPIPRGFAGRRVVVGISEVVNEEFGSIQRGSCRQWPIRFGCGRNCLSEFRGRLREESFCGARRRVA
jgi:hypothetical protein